MLGSKPIQVLKDSLYAVKFYYEARPWLFILLVLVFAAQTVLPAAGLLLEKAIVDRFVEGAHGFVPLAIAAYLLARLAGSLAE